MHPGRLVSTGFAIVLDSGNQRLSGWTSVIAIMLLLAAAYVWLARQTTVALVVPDSTAAVRFGPRLFTIAALPLAQLAFGRSLRGLWSRGESGRNREYVRPAAALVATVPQIRSTITSGVKPLRTARLVSTQVE